MDLDFEDEWLYGKQKKEWPIINIDNDDFDY